MNPRPLLLLTLCLLVGTTLWVWGKRSALQPGGRSDANQSAQTTGVPLDVRSVLASKIEALDPNDRQKFLQVQASLDSLGDRPVQSAGVWKSLSSFWLTRDDLLGAALCLDKATELQPASDNFRDAGLYYGSAIHSLPEEDTATAAFCRNKSTAMLAKALESKPDDLDLKADWANALVQSSPAPCRAFKSSWKLFVPNPNTSKLTRILPNWPSRAGNFPKP